jgi:predicted short-subunit dehydrogenase-like oxidoreductase (DUF2520 family)
MRITLVGPGRAGTALALAARAADHEIAAVLARRPEAAAAVAAELGGAVPLPLEAEIPSGDLLVIATRDDAIGATASTLAKRAGAVAAAVHLSGLASVDVLEPLARQGLAVGSFHPLQTLPSPEAGAARLRGAWIAVTTEDPDLHRALATLAESIGGRPFDLADEAKALYHAAAASAANFPLAALAMASDLFEAAGVPFEAAGPLISAVVDNALEMGPRHALTGPVARGDLATVEAQVQAVDSAMPAWAAGFCAFVAELAKIAGKEEQFAHLSQRTGT